MEGKEDQRRHPHQKSQNLQPGLRVPTESSVGLPYYRGVGAVAAVAALAATLFEIIP